MNLKFCSFELKKMGSTESSVKSFFEIKRVLFLASCNQNVEARTYQIEFKLNEKFWSKYKLSDPVIIQASHFYSFNVTSFYLKLEIITTKVS